jgi:AraC-like DNA-binding protein
VELPCPLLSQAPMNADIPQLGYSPETPYALDLEVFTMAELRLRGDKQQVRTTHRYEFHTLVCVTRGTCTQVVDFRSVSCAAGSVLVLRPGQTHNFGPDEDWDGWIVPFRPEFVSPASAAPRDAKLVIDIWRLPEHVALTQDELQTISGAIAQMRGDTQLDGPHDDLHALLRHQLHAMLTRLGLLQARRHAQQLVNSPALQRFKRFQELVDEHFAQWHQVKEYASQLGYTEKSLARAVAASAGTTAKAFIAGRITLEAKRLLVHTDQPVATIGDRLGFDEPTNFSKFFKREARCTPAEFRQQQRTSS